MLKSIELIGFKSFAKKGKLSFASPITAIVGPNGSGKSNTAEAFRFVLGEQSGKSMRIKKGTDLIWGGSSAVPKGSRAGVKVILDNSANKLGIDFSEVIIERIVLRDGSNEYLVNGSKVRLKDVQDLLAGANIGSSGHHIISQGQADRVLGASPMERREMLEDALGLKAYQLKKAEAARKLEATAINLEKAESRRREVLPHLKFLSRQVARVEQARQVRTELKVQALMYFTAERDALIAEVQALQKESPAPRAELREVEQLVASVRSNIAEAKASASERQGSSTEIAELERHKQQLISLRSTHATLRTELGKVSGQLEMLKVVEGKAKALPSSLPIADVKALLEQLATILESADIQQAKAIVQDFVNKRLSPGSEQAPADISIESERSKLKAIERELSEQVAGQEQAITKQEASLAQAQAAVVQGQQQGTELERDLYKATAKYNELKSIVAELDSREAELTRRKTALQENVGEVQVLIGEEFNDESKRSDLQGELRPHDDGPDLNDDAQTAPTRRDIERLKITLEQHGTLGTEVVAEFKEAQTNHDFLTQEIADLEGAASKLSSLIGQLDTRMQEQFTKGLALINREFNNFFNTLFDGGSASLTLQSVVSADADGELSDEQGQVSGVDVQVSLPRKKVTTLETLSGGERALASIALIFAMSQVNPPPFIILDETDAALDEANSQRYAKIVQQLSSRSQVILITHNRATMASADTIYGVTMGSDGMSKLLSVQLTDAEQYAK